MDPSMDVGSAHEPSRSCIPARSDLTGLYHLGRTLGRGHYAVVKLARQINTGQLVAVKMIDKTKLDVMATSHLLQEVRCMRLVQHPNVVRLYEVVDTPTTLYLIMELAEGGDLYDYILRHEGGVAEATAKRHFAQIVRAVAYCHQLHVVHRDLKPENVVFFPQQGAVKLTDFGFSNLFQPGTMLATSCGSLAYSAPEILLGEEYDAPAVDIWSLGVILYMLVCGALPFQETNDSETLVMILDCRYCVPEHVSGGCKDLISRMLQKDPSSRASLEEIQAHGWLQGLNDALLSPEAPPHWLSGTMSPGSPRAGLPECGDLLAARSAPQQPFPGPCQPALSFTLRPPAVEEPPAPKSLPALQQICEEEEEEVDEDEEEEGEVEVNMDVSLGTEAAVVLEVDGVTSDGGEEPPAGLMEIMEEEEEEEETGSEDGEDVISDQPISHRPPCCQLLSQSSGQESEPNNNHTHKPPPTEATPPKNTAPPPNTAAPPPPTTTVLVPGDRDPPKAGSEGAGEQKAEAGRFQAHNAPGAREETAAAVAVATPKVERGGKRHSVKLRERLFHFPLCEKALAFNLPSHNKPKILPLAQYNCCHVL